MTMRARDDDHDDQRGHPNRAGVERRNDLLLPPDPRFTHAGLSQTPTPPSMKPTSSPGLNV